LKEDLKAVWRTDSSLDSFLQSFFVAAGDVHLGSIALEGLGDDEAQAGTTFSEG
jgi:hypothetical protein